MTKTMTMTTLTCPDCGDVSERETLTRSAADFCPVCDFPLFWAPAGVALLSGAERDGDDALRRLPGAGGHRQRVTRRCPDCGEQNPLGRTDCLRCSALLDPPEPEPVVLEAEPEPVPEPVVVAPKGQPRWFWPALIIGLVTVTVLILLLSR